jgi:hypothetical protein
MLNKFFVDVLDNYKKMKKIWKNFRKIIFLNCLKRLQKNFLQKFFPVVEKYSKFQKFSKKCNMTPSIWDVFTKQLVLTKFNKAVNLIIKQFLSDQTGIPFFSNLRFFLEKSRFWSQKIIIFFPKNVLISFISDVDPKTTDLASVLY